MRLNFNNETLNISSRKVITGVISIEVCRERFFPEQNWNDSMIVILNSWLQNIIDMINGEQNEAQFVFFDGPFSFVIKQENVGCQIEFFQNSISIQSLKIDFDEFAYHLLKSCREILQEINIRMWESDETRDLEDLLCKNDFSVLRGK